MWTSKYHNREQQSWWRDLCWKFKRCQMLVIKYRTLTSWKYIIYIRSCKLDIYCSEWGWQNNNGWSRLHTIGLQRYQAPQYNIQLCKIAHLRNWTRTPTAANWEKKTRQEMLGWTQEIVNIWRKRKHVGVFRFRDTIPHMGGENILVTIKFRDTISNMSTMNRAGEGPDNRISDLRHLNNEPSKGQIKIKTFKKDKIPKCWQWTKQRRVISVRKGLKIASHGIFL